MSAPLAGVLRRWRPLLRIAWRDAVRHRARSALVLTLIALPVLAVTAADVLYQTSTISGSEALDRRLGGADARIEVNDWTGSVLQWPDPDRGFSSGDGASAGSAASLDELGASLGRPLRGIELRTGELRVDTDRGVSSALVTELDLRDPLTKGLFRIDEGRAAIAPDEVVVNGDLAARGPRLGSTLTLTDGASLKVVGIAESTTSFGSPTMVAFPGSVTLPAPAGSRTWLVDAGGPVTWADVRRLNGLGATVLSREVLQHPPADAEVPAKLRDMTAATDSQSLAIIGLIVVMVLLEVVLLAGPAFAVGARRQSRNLALMAATGGTPPQARRTILASGLVLGTMGALLGIGLGLVAGWALEPVVQRLSHTYLGPYDVAWTHLLGVAVFGLVSALLAAIVPAWIASRQDVVAVLAGRRGDREAGLRSPILGLVLLAVGVGGSAYGARATGNGEFMIAFAAIFAVLGMVLLVPLLLVGLARVSGRLPLALRFAIRDAARNRTRTVPAVAAVAATVAGVVALGVANSSDAAQNRDQYVPMLAAGDGIVRAYEARPEDWAPIGQVLQRELPGATVTPLEGVPEGGVNGPSVSLRFRGAGRTDFLYSYGSHLGASLLVGDRLPELPDLPRDQVAALNRTLAAGGAVLFANELPDASDVTVSGRRFNADGTPADRIKPQSIKAAFAQVPQDASVPQAVLSPELAQRLGVQVATVAMYVSGAEISPDQARNAGEAVAAIVPYADLYVERGYTGDDATRILLLILGGLGAVLMLGGTLTTTYLALSDARPDLATLAAVGAAPRMRRGVAGAFAVVVALVGGLVGAVIGFIPGVAVTYPLTSTVGDSYVSSGSGSSGFNGDFPPATGPYLDIPWLLVGTLVIGLPLVTALVVSLTTRSRLPLIARVD